MDTKEPKKSKKYKPVPVSKEEMAMSIATQLPKLYELQKQLNSSIEVLRNNRTSDVTFTAIEAVEKCLAEFDGAEDPKKVLKEIQKVMKARLRTRTSEIVKG